MFFSKAINATRKSLKPGLSQILYFFISAPLKYDEQNAGRRGEWYSLYWRRAARGGRGVSQGPHCSGGYQRDLRC